MTMRYELLAQRILEGAAVRFPNKEIVTRVGEERIAIPTPTC